MLWEDATEPAWCRHGRRSGRVCCADSCRSCTGPDCKGACCGGYLISRGWVCEDEDDFSCIIPRDRDEWRSALPSRATARVPSLGEVELVVPVGGKDACRTLRDILGRSLQLFWPKARLMLLLDESPEGRRLAESCRGLGRLEFVQPAGLGHWKEGQRLRLTADRLAASEFVGFVDADTLFVTPVTQASLFDAAGRPRVRGRRGDHPAGGFWWGAAMSTELLLGVEEVARCMAYFPVIVRTEHLAGLRRFLEEMHGDRLDDMLREMVWSEFNVLCTYLYHFHRREYSWTFQRSEAAAASRPDEPMWVSVAQHAGWMPGGAGPSASALLAARLAEGYCWAAGDAATQACRDLQLGGLHLDLFRFEDMQWALHPGAARAQAEHYRRVREELRLPPAEDERELLQSSRLLWDLEFQFPHRALAVDESQQHHDEDRGMTEAVDLTQCFVGQGVVHAARLRAVGNLSGMVLRAIPGAVADIASQHHGGQGPPEAAEGAWGVVRGEAACELWPDAVREGLWNCHLVTPLKVQVGDCIGWAYDRGALAFGDDLASGRVLLRRGGDAGAVQRLWRRYALSVLWREVPFESQVGDGG